MVKGMSKHTIYFASQGKGSSAFANGIHVKRPTINIDPDSLVELAKVSLSVSGIVYACNEWKKLNDIEIAMVKAVEKKTGASFVFPGRT